MPAKWKWLIALNPLTGIIETVRYGLLGLGSFNINYFAYSICFTILIFLIGVIIFNKTEKTFMDTV
jgi:lipopolysaccharide transport system permease protein